MAMALFDHLEDNCGGLHPSELINLPTRMIGFYQKPEGIPEYSNYLEDAQYKLSCAKLPMSNEQLLAIASTAVLAAQHFPCALDEWEALPPTAKMLTAWKTTFRSAHIARIRQLLATGGNGATQQSPCRHGCHIRHLPLAGWVPQQPCQRSHTGKNHAHPTIVEACLAGD
jgi:hypothetical protein